MCEVNVGICHQGFPLVTGKAVEIVARFFFFFFFSVFGAIQSLNPKPLDPRP